MGPQFLAPDKYKAAKKMEKLRKALKGAVETDHEFAKLARLADAESKDNELEQARQRNRPLVYGQTVQVRQAFTNRYLQVSTSEAARLDNLNMQVSLTLSSSRRTCIPPTCARGTAAQCPRM